MQLYCLPAFVLCFLQKFSPNILPTREVLYGPKFQMRKLELQKKLSTLPKFEGVIEPGLGLFQGGVVTGSTLPAGRG